MSTQTLKQYALNSTYEISCLTNMAKVAEEVGAKGVTIPAGHNVLHRGQIHRP